MKGITVDPKKIAQIAVGWLAVAAVVGGIGYGAYKWGQRQAPDAPFVTLPAEVRAEPGQYVDVDAETNCTTILWTLPDAGLHQFPPHALRSGNHVIVAASRVGRYRVQAQSASGGVPTPVATCWVVVGGAPPVPPVPPVPPNPNDPFGQALQAAYTAETDAGKAASKASLAALYRQSADTAGNPSVATWGALVDVMSDAAKSIGVSGKLPGVQAAVQAELRKELPTSRTAPLDAAGRSLAGRNFTKVATALEGVR